MNKIKYFIIIFLVITLIITLYLSKKYSIEKFEDNNQLNITDIYVVRKGEDCLDGDKKKEDITDIDLSNKETINSIEEIQNGINKKDTEYEFCYKLVKDDYEQGVTNLEIKKLNEKCNANNDKVASIEGKEIQDRSEYLGCYALSKTDQELHKNKDDNNFKKLREEIKYIDDDIKTKSECHDKAFGNTKDYYGFTANINNYDGSKIEDKKGFCHTFDTRPSLRRVRDEYCASNRYMNDTGNANIYMGGLTSDNIPTLALYQTKKKKGDKAVDSNIYKLKEKAGDIVTVQDLRNFINNSQVYFSKLRLFRGYEITSELDIPVKNETNKTINPGVILTEPAFINQYQELKEYINVDGKFNVAGESEIKVTESELQNNSILISFTFVVFSELDGSLNIGKNTDLTIHKNGDKFEIKYKSSNVHRDNYDFNKVIDLKIIILDENTYFIINGKKKEIKSKSNNYNFDFQNNEDSRIIYGKIYKYTIQEKDKRYIKTFFTNDIYEKLDGLSDSFRQVEKNRLIDDEYDYVFPFSYKLNNSNAIQNFMYFSRNLELNINLNPILSTKNNQRIELLRLESKKAVTKSITNLNKETDEGRFILLNRDFILKMNINVDFNIADSHNKVYNDFFRIRNGTENNDSWIDRRVALFYKKNEPKFHFVINDETNPYNQKSFDISVNKNVTNYELEIRVIKNYVVCILNNKLYDINKPHNNWKYRTVTLDAPSRVTFKSEYPDTYGENTSITLSNIILENLKEDTENQFPTYLLEKIGDEYWEVYIKDDEENTYEYNKIEEDIIVNNIYKTKIENILLNNNTIYSSEINTDYVVEAELINLVDKSDSKSIEFLDLYRIPCENLLLHHYFIKDYSGNNNHIRFVNRSYKCNINLLKLDIDEINQEFNLNEHNYIDFEKGNNNIKNDEINVRYNIKNSNKSLHSSDLLMLKEEGDSNKFELNENKNIIQNVVLSDNFHLSFDLEIGEYVPPEINSGYIKTYLENNPDEEKYLRVKDKKIVLAGDKKDRSLFKICDGKLKHIFKSEDERNIELDCEELKDVYEDLFNRNEGYYCQSILTEDHIEKNTEDDRYDYLYNDCYADENCNGFEHNKGKLDEYKKENPYPRMRFKNYNGINNVNPENLYTDCNFTWFGSGSNTVNSEYHEGKGCNLGNHEYFTKGVPEKWKKDKDEQWNYLYHLRNHENVLIKAGHQGYVEIYATAYDSLDPELGNHMRQNQGMISWEELVGSYKHVLVKQGSPQVIAHHNSGIKTLNSAEWDNSIKNIKVNGKENINEFQFGDASKFGFHSQGNPFSSNVINKNDNTYGSDHKFNIYNYTNGIQVKTAAPKNNQGWMEDLIVHVTKRNRYLEKKDCYRKKEESELQLLSENIDDLPSNIVPKDIRHSDILELTTQYGTEGKRRYLTTLKPVDDERVFFSESKQGIQKWKFESSDEKKNIFNILKIHQDDEDFLLINYEEENKTIVLKHNGENCISIPFNLEDYIKYQQKKTINIDLIKSNNYIKLILNKNTIKKANKSISFRCADVSFQILYTSPGYTNKFKNEKNFIKNLKLFNFDIDYKNNYEKLLYTQQIDDRQSILLNTYQNSTGEINVAFIVDTNKKITVDEDNSDVNFTNEFNSVKDYTYTQKLFNKLNTCNTDDNILIDYFHIFNSGIEKIKNLDQKDKEKIYNKLIDNEDRYFSKEYNLEDQTLTSRIILLNDLEELYFKGKDYYRTNINEQNENTSNDIYKYKICMFRHPNLSKYNLTVKAKNKLSTDTRLASHTFKPS